MDWVADLSPLATEQEGHAEEHGANALGRLLRNRAVNGRFVLRQRDGRAICGRRGRIRRTGGKGHKGSREDNREAVSHRNDRNRTRVGRGGFTGRGDRSTTVTQSIPNVKRPSAILRTMRYLITGGAGFIGSHLSEQLLAAGHSVVVLDDFSTGRIENIQHLLNSPERQGRFSLIRGSVEDADTVNLAASNCDAVFHLAAAVGVQLIADEPVRTIRSIVHGTEVVLEACNRWGRPVLVTSTSEVYGKGTRVPFSEDDDIAIGPTVHARWCYAYAKGIDEFLALAYHKQFGLKVTVVRLFNTVGPRQVGRYGMVLPRFADRALAGEPLVVTGDGSQTRCFCHVEDVAGALVKLLDAPDAVGRVFNVGSDEEVSIRDLAEQVVSAAGSDSDIEAKPYEAVYGQAFEDVMRRVPDLSRVRSVIDFQPKYDLKGIIEAVVADRRNAR